MCNALQCGIPPRRFDRSLKQRRRPRPGPPQIRDELSIPQRSRKISAVLSRHLPEAQKRSCFLVAIIGRREATTSIEQEHAARTGAFRRSTFMQA